MVKTTRILVAALIALIMFSGGAASASDAVKCTECGMNVDMNSHYTSRIVQGNTTSYFCDIGDLFSFVNKNGTKDGRIEVRDNLTGEWIDARSASYVHAEKKFRTPMGWGIAAFKDKSKAAEFGAVMDFAATSKSVK